MLSEKVLFVPPGSSDDNIPAPESPEVLCGQRHPGYCLKNETPQVQNLVEQGQKGELKTQPGKSMMESLEASINLVLNRCRDDSGTSAQQSLSETNAVKAMATAGSKGSFINISQIPVLFSWEIGTPGYGIRRRRCPPGSSEKKAQDSWIAHVRKPTGLGEKIPRV